MRAEFSRLFAAAPTSGRLLGVPLWLWLAVLLALALIVFTRRILQLLRVLRLGRAEVRWDRPRERLKQFAVEVMGQSRMRHGDSIINWAHPLVFWGFCCFLVASGLMLVGGVFNPWLSTSAQVPQVEQIPVIGPIVDVFAVLVLVGLVASSYRRYVKTPPGLQRTLDATLVVVLIVLLMVTYVIDEAGTLALEAATASGDRSWLTFLPFGTAVCALAPPLGISNASLQLAGAVAWWLHVGVLLFFLVYLPYSKHMHLIWAPFAVFLGVLDDRKGELPRPPEPSAMADDAKTVADPATQLGEFTWRQLLNAYTCAECGRCERACPVHSGGGPLSPRELIHQLKGYMLDQGSRFVGRRVTNGNGHVTATDDQLQRHLVGDLVAPAALWSCTTCGACEEVCPVRNEHVPLVVGMRRKLLDGGQLDASLQDSLMALQRYGNSLAKPGRKRLAWADGLDPPIVDATKQPVETLWFVGDYAAYHPVAAQVTRFVAELFGHAELSFGCLGRAEKSAGNDVRRVGEEGLFEVLVEHNVQAIAKTECRSIVTTDPHTYHTLKHEYADFGLDLPVYHYTELLADMLADGRLQVNQRIPGIAVFHDPCYLGRYNGIYTVPRQIIEATGMTLHEMPRHHERSFCCGAGGGQIWMEDNTEVAERPAIVRVREALTDLEVTHLVVACPKDLTMFQDAVKTLNAEARLQVVDVAQLVSLATTP